MAHVAIAAKKRFSDERGCYYQAIIRAVADDLLGANHGLLFPYRIGEELPTKRPLCETWARMSHPDPNGAPDRRLIKVGEVWENPVTGERSVILERPWDNPASPVTGELTALVGARVM